MASKWMKILPALSLIEDHLLQKDQQEEIISKIISTFPGLIWVYAIIRFRIIPLRFLAEIEQHLPNQGIILDLGCGFGLFSLYMAMRKPDIQILGIDMNHRRLQIARNSAQKLGLTNINFVEADLRQWAPDQNINAAYALDVFHHLPENCGNELLEALFGCMQAGGKLVLKDIDTHPRLMLIFTYLMDRMVSPRDHLTYRSAEMWKEKIISYGFNQVFMHYLWDIFPYPHILFVGTKPDFISDPSRHSD
jgi:2-polyprenyl-3-methyl-5-hydroxy-6-metoxy-1,4-benzoquinol methylase